MKTEIFWIGSIPVGRLGIAPRPRGGDWLDNEVQAWRATGVDCVVSALTPVEEAELDLQNEEEACRDQGVQFVSLPIPDRGTPPSVSSLYRVVSLVIQNLKSDRTVVIHCRQGIGRASLIAASALAATGEDSDHAFSRIERARGCPVPDTQEQRVWVREFADELRRAVAEGTRSTQPARRAYRRGVTPNAHA